MLTKSLEPKKRKVEVSFWTSLRRISSNSGVASYIELSMAEHLEHNSVINLHAFGDARSPVRPTCMARVWIFL